MAIVLSGHQAARAHQVKSSETAGRDADHETLRRGLVIRGQAVLGKVRRCRVPVFGQFSVGGGCRVCLRGGGASRFLVQVRSFRRPSQELLG